jgi:hypothetical protein
MSLGSILGGGWIASSQIHDRAVLMAGGSSFSFLIGRSDLFEALMLLCDFQFYKRSHSLPPRSHHPSLPPRSHHPSLPPRLL